MYFLLPPIIYYCFFFFLFAHLSQVNPRVAWVRPFFTRLMQSSHVVVGWTVNRIMDVTGFYQPAVSPPPQVASGSMTLLPPAWIAAESGVSLL